MRLEACDTHRRDREPYQEETVSSALVTTDHAVIRHWVEERAGLPASVRSTGSNAGDPGILRIDFEPKEESLETLDWDTFFDAFEENNLAFLYQEHTKSGRISRFCKFVDRDSVPEDQDIED